MGEPSLRRIGGRKCGQPKQHGIRHRQCLRKSPQGRKLQLNTKFGRLSMEKSMLESHRMIGSSFSRRILLALLGIVLPLLMFARPTAAASRRGGKATVPAIQNLMTLKCQFGASTRMTANSESVVGDVVPSGGLVTFTVVDGKLVIVADDGGEPLHLLSSNPISGATYFAGQTPSGNIALWSSYGVKERRVLFIKQNNYVSGAPGGQVVVWNHAGFCDTTGGDGLPISK
jgi:hypothetical protein